MGQLCLIRRRGKAAFLKILVQELANMDEVTGALTMTQPEQDILSLIQGIVNLRLRLVADSGDLASSSDKAAHHAQAVHDLGVIFDMEWGGDKGY